MVDYVRGKYPSLKPLPDKIREYILVKRTGWILDYVRSLSVKDHEVMSLLSTIDESWETSRQDKILARL